MFVFFFGSTRHFLDRGDGTATSVIDPPRYKMWGVTIEVTHPKGPLFIFWGQSRSRGISKRYICALAFKVFGARCWLWQKFRWEKLKQKVWKKRQKPGHYFWAGFWHQTISVCASTVEGLFYACYSYSSINQVINGSLIAISKGLGFLERSPTMNYTAILRPVCNTFLNARQKLGRQDAHRLFQVLWGEMVTVCFDMPLSPSKKSRSSWTVQLPILQRQSPRMGPLPSKNATVMDSNCT